MVYTMDAWVTQAVDDVPAQLTVGRLNEGSGLIPDVCVGQKIGKIKRHGGVQGLPVNENLGCKKL
jgi:hypothetical protein